MNTVIRLIPVIKARKRKVKKSIPIYIRLSQSVNNKQVVKFWNTKILIESEKHWSTKKNCVLKGDDEYFLKNEKLEKKIKQFKQVLLHNNDKKRPMTIKRLIQLADPSYDTDLFIPYSRKKIEKNSILKDSSKETYYKILNKMAQWDDKVTFADLESLETIEEFENFMIAELGNKKSTASKGLSVLRTFIKIAQKDGKIINNVFDDKPLKKYTGEREFLSVVEINRLEEFRESDDAFPSEKNVATYYLFACYTGLRYTDIRDLRYMDINDNKVSVLMEKTEKKVYIPLSSHAKNLIPNGKKHEPEQKIFRVVTNQVTNRILKKIARKTQINKQLSFHTARHTFATASLSLGIDIMVIRDLLGHSDLKTTQIYAKIESQYRNKEMEKWETIK